MTSQQSSQGEGYATQLQPQSHSSELNAMAFVFQMMMGKVRTATLVKVVAVTNSGDLSPVGRVDVQPLINQVDSAQNGQAHSVVMELPYFRLQGGANAIVMDPKVGDIGVAIFSDRDISTVKATRARSNPGSKRRFNMADGLYVGGFLNGAPTQVVQFTDTGINVISPGVVNVQAGTSVGITAPVISLNGGIVLNGPVSSGTATGAGPMNITGPINVTNDVTAGGKSLKTHTHPQSGGGNTGAPN